MNQEKRHFIKWYTDEYDNLIKSFCYKNKELEPEQPEEFVKRYEDDWLDYVEEQYEEYKRQLADQMRSAQHIKEV